MAVSPCYSKRDSHHFFGEKKGGGGGGLYDVVLEFRVSLSEVVNSQILAHHIPETIATHFHSAWKKLGYMYNCPCCKSMGVLDIKYTAPKLPNSLCKHFMYYYISLKVSYSCQETAQGIFRHYMIC